MGKTTKKVAALAVVGWLLTGPAVFLIGCATTVPMEEKTYADQAEEIFEQGQRSLERRDYLSAMGHYNTVRNEYPYSRWAAMANLRIADAYFEQEQYASAVQQYRSFIQLYPRHEEVEYAYWRIANAFYEQMPGDLFFLPPAYERDLSSTRDAVREMQIFLRRYQDSQYSEEASRKLRQALRRLGDHEFYVATYYLDRENPRAAANRLTFLLRNYSGLGLDPEALYLLGKAYLQLDEPDRAVMAWTDLVEAYPRHARAEEVGPMLEKQ